MVDRNRLLGLNATTRKFRGSAIADLAPALTGIDAGQDLEIASRTTIDFNIRAAERHIDLPTITKVAGQERPLRERHVVFLFNQMRERLFRWELVTLITCEYQGVTYRMNGQHTAWARMEMPVEYECKVTMIHYRAKTADAVRALYASIDRGAPRTSSHVVGNYLVGTTEFPDASGQTLGVVASGLNLYLAGQHLSRTPDELAHLMKTTHLKASQMIVDCYGSRYGGCEHGHIQRSPVVAAMFATFYSKKASRADWVSFWQFIKDGVGETTNRNDPRLKLRNHLMKTSVVTGAGRMRSDAGYEKQSQENMLRSCLAAWNAWREGRTISMLRKSFDGDRQVVR